MVHHICQLFIPRMSPRKQTTLSKSAIGDVQMLVEHDELLDVYDLLQGDHRP